MANPLRSTRQDQQMLSVSSTTNSDPMDIGSTEGPISVQIAWKNASSVDMIATLELSNDKEFWVPLTAQQRVIDSDTSESHIWDLSTGVEYLRVNILVNGGSADFTIKLNGKSR